MAELTLTTFLTLDGVMQAPSPHEDTSGNFPPVASAFAIPYHTEALAC